MRSGVSVCVPNGTERASTVYLVDMYTVGDERYFILIDTFHPERNRIEKVSDARFAEFLQKVLDTDIPVSEIEQEVAA